MHVDLKMVKPLILQEIKYVMKITFLVYYVSAYTSGPLRGPPWARSTCKPPFQRICKLNFLFLPVEICKVCAIIRSLI